MDDIIYQDDAAKPPVRIVRLAEDDAMVEAIVGGKWRPTDDADAMYVYMRAFLHAHDQINKMPDHDIPDEDQ